jgi:hypothetical protein
VQQVATARPEALAADLRALALDVGAGRAWVEKVQVQVRPALETGRLAGGDDPVGLLLRELAGLAQDEARLGEMVRDVLKDLRQKLPADLSQEDALRLEDPQVLKALLGEVEGELLARLTAVGGA